MDQCLAQEKFLWTFPRLATNQKIYIIFFTGACTRMVRGMGSRGSNYNALITVLQKKVQEVCMAKRQCKIVCGSIHKT